MRIRHGTLSGQLRTPLEVEKIITQRAAGTEHYEKNLFWQSRLNHLDESSRAAVDARLARFSADYDAFISRIANELIQIRSNEKPSGLFNISVKSVRFRIWIASITGDMTFEAFLDKCFELFWESVGECLEDMRTVIDGSLKSDVVVIFGKLEADIARLTAGASTADLTRAIRIAQTAAQQALDLVKDWFRLSQPLSEPSFPIKDLIDVGLECVRTIHREFAPIVQTRVPPLPPFAHALTLFSDIFFIIFDNIRRHSGKGEQPRVDINITDLGDRLRVCTRSEIDPGIYTIEARAKIERIKSIISTGDYQKAIRSEGGTGLIKLRKLIGSAEKAPARLEFGYEDEGHFVVDFELGKREIKI
jgi:hypothetical protein